MLDVSIKIANYRSYGESPEGFDRLPNVTVIVGRNNTGKSALLDAIDLALNPRVMPIERGDVPPRLVIERPVAKEELLGPWQGQQELAQQFHRASFAWSLDLGNARHGEFRGRDGAHYVSSVKADGRREELGSSGDGLVRHLYKSTLTAFQLRRITAERDVRPEGREETSLEGNGAGATCLMHNFANVAKYPRQLLEDDFLRALNRIFEPDCRFEGIWVRDTGKDRWEVFLRETRKGAVPLSKSGSGLKTVILVLCHLILMPVFDGHDVSRTIFAFEELENNLHPAVLRRLMAFLAERAERVRTHFVLTTHSAVVIDAFASDPRAQVLHVTHDGATSKVGKVATYAGARNAIVDLGVRASDLLQSNGVVWVEGPSDQIYVNRWIELATNGELREGAHYQCMFYGGRLLARLDAGPPTNRRDDASVSALRINANAAVIIDSDKRKAEDKVNATKQRISSEVQAVNGSVWVTEGREIENYVSPDVVAKVLGLPQAPEPVGQFQQFEDYLDGVKAGEGKKFKASKVTFAAQVAPLMDARALGVRDVGARVAELVARIRAWNST